MATLNAALAALERRIGFPQSRSRTVARRLQEAGVLPVGAPGVAPELGVDNIVDLVIALAADTSLHTAADAVRSYRALTPGGSDLANAPASIDTAGRALDIWADIAVHDDASVLRQDRIEVVANWPEIAIATPDGVRRFAPVGPLASNWQASGHRRSTTINGAALVDCLRELFFKE